MAGLASTQEAIGRHHPGWVPEDHLLPSPPTPTEPLLGARPCAGAGDRAHSWSAHTPVGGQSQLQRIMTGATKRLLTVEPGRGRLSREIREASWQRRHSTLGLSWDRGEGRLAKKKPGDHGKHGQAWGSFPVRVRG